MEKTRTRRRTRKKNKGRKKGAAVTRQEQVVSSAAKVEARDDDRTVLDGAAVATITLNHKVDGETEFALLTLSLTRKGHLTKSALNEIRIKSDTSDIIPPTHETLELTRLRINILTENLHHILLRIRGGMGTSVTVLRDVEGFVGVQETEDVGVWRGVDDGRRDDLIHCLVIVGFGGVVHETCAAHVDGAGEEGHAKRFVVCDALEGADEIGALEILLMRELS